MSRSILLASVPTRATKTHHPTTGKVKISRRHRSPCIGMALQIARVMGNAVTTVIPDGDGRRTALLVSREPAEPYRFQLTTRNEHSLLQGAGAPVIPLHNVANAQKFP
jgi:hypothetical protein